MMKRISSANNVALLLLLVLLFAPRVTVVHEAIVCDYGAGEPECLKKVETPKPKSERPKPNERLPAHLQSDASSRPVESVA